MIPVSPLSRQEPLAQTPKALAEPSLWMQGDAVDSVLPLRTYSMVLTFVSTLLNGLLAIMWLYQPEQNLSLYHVGFALSTFVILIAIHFGMHARWYLPLITLVLTTGIWFFSVSSFHYSAFSILFLFFTCLYHFVIRTSLAFAIQVLSLAIASQAPFLSQLLIASSAPSSSQDWAQDLMLFTLVYITVSAYAYYYARTFAAHSKLITEKNLQLEASEHQLRYLERKKNKFIADMNHELRTPLNAILGIADIIHNQKMTASELDLLLRQMQQAGDQLLGIINDVLDLTRIHEDTITLQTKSSSLAGVVDHAVSVIQPLAQVKGLDLLVNYEGDCLQRILVDDKKLSQVMINLLGNAVKFSHQGRIQLKVKLMPSDAPSATDSLALRYIITVEDEGIGIDAQHLPHIFEEFNQGASSTHDQFGGSGLGLHISKKFVDMMGGRISVESSPGKGSRFSIDIAFERAPQSHSQMDKELENQANATPDCSPKETLLRVCPTLTIHIVDDNKLNLMVAQKLLASYYPDYKTHTLEDPSTLLEAMKGQPSDAILLDVNIPGHSTLSVVRMLRQTYPKTKVIAFTADSTFVQTNAWRLHGYHGVLLKPFKVEALTQLFLQLFANPAPPLAPETPRLAPNPPPQTSHSATTD